MIDEPNDDDNSRNDSTGDAPEEAAAPAPRRRSRRAAAPVAEPEPSSADAGDAATAEEEASAAGSPPALRPVISPPIVLFQAPEVVTDPAGEAGSADAGDELDEAPRRSRRRSSRAEGNADDDIRDNADDRDSEDAGSPEAAEGADDDDEGGPRRRRRRGGRGRKRAGGDDTAEDAGETSEEETSEDAGGELGEGSDEDAASVRRRRRRRRRGTGDDLEPAPDDPPHTVVRVREPRKRARSTEDSDTSAKGIKGSTRLEAKKQRRREGREQGRNRVPIITEAEFLARRESVERVMVVRQHGDKTQIAVLEDGILVEHYVNKASATSYVGNVYLGRVQNVLPSMEAAFVDIGKGRNAVLYAGEVNWDAAGMEGQPKRIETALKSGDSVMVQVTKDPIGHKGARLTSQISLPGRFLVYVPENQMTGISRKLPDVERSRLKSILRTVLPEEAGVIVRTAAEGATEEELSRDVARLQGQWNDIVEKAKSASAPALLHSEPDLTTRVIRDIFNEDFAQLIVSGDDAWNAVAPYVEHVAPDLMERAEKWTKEDDLFAAYRVDEQLAKALDRKVWLPSGGSLVIDRTEAMIVVDVNTGKFTGKGGNLEETVTKNNLEAAEEIVRQLRLRDLGGIIVIDFIDMVLESNRQLVLRRLLECLGRDRTKHQVAEVTSLGLVQMTRKRVGQGLLEAFSEPCETCGGNGVIINTDAAGRPMGGSERSDGPRPVAGLPREVLAKMPLPRAAKAAAAEAEPGEEPVRVRPPRRSRSRGAADKVVAEPTADVVEKPAEESGGAVAAIEPATQPPGAPVASESEGVLPPVIAPSLQSSTPAPRARRPRRATRPAGSAAPGATATAEEG